MCPKPPNVLVGLFCKPAIVYMATVLSQLSRVFRLSQPMQYPDVHQRIATQQVHKCTTSGQLLYGKYSKKTFGLSRSWVANPLTKISLLMIMRKWAVWLPCMLPCEIIYKKIEQIVQRVIRYIFVIDLIFCRRRQSRDPEVFCQGYVSAARHVEI